MPSPSLLRPQQPPVTSARELARTFALRVEPPQAPDADITGIELRAQEVRPGDLFAALPGARSHGARFAADALDRGAVAVLTDRAGLDILAELDLRSAMPTVLVHTDPRSVLGVVSAAVYGDPSARMTVLGITGTSGKTTTAYLAEAALRAGGRTPGLIGTIETRIGDRPVPSALTTPEAPNLHAMFAAMLEQGVDTVVMEVSSHALALGRVDGTTFAVGGFTNLSRDHLDFHDTFEEYFAAKARLFDTDSNVHASASVVCVDDDWGRRMAELAGATPGRVLETVSTTAADATWLSSGWRADADGTQSFDVVGPHGRAHGRIGLPGKYNVANAVLAAAMCAQVGIDPSTSLAAMTDVDVPGRMQRVERGQDFLAVVDYAHKPAALDAVLATLRAQTDGRIAVVVGAGGDRDAQKRPMMGVAAAAAADLLVITDDNPRSEDPAVIRAAVRTGAESVPEDSRADVMEYASRRDAIVAAVRWARPGDVVLVAGKGHEVGQDVAGTKHAFDDRIVLAEALDDVLAPTAREDMPAPEPTALGASEEKGPL